MGPQKTPYLVTELAGDEVAGVRSPGAGQQIWLTREAAAQPLRLGQITKRHPLDHDGDRRPGGSLPKTRRRRG